MFFFIIFEVIIFLGLIRHSVFFSDYFAACLCFAFEDSKITEMRTVNILICVEYRINLNLKMSKETFRFYFYNEFETNL
jgi:hypothetical protein